jgi:hypothetical protein
MGAGPMTGGARGRCNPATAATRTAYGGGYSRGRGLGLRLGFRGGHDLGRDRGRGYGRGYPPAASPAYSRDATREVNILKADADDIQKSLDAINKRIEELENKPAESS